MHAKYIAILSLLFCLLTVRGQHLSQGDLELSRDIDAIPGAEINTMYLDNMGLLWLGTTLGVYCYDGYQLQSLRNTVTSPHFLPGHDILSLAGEGDTVLWIGTNNGICRYHRVSGKTTHYHLQGHDQQKIYSLHVARNHTLFVGTDAGLSFLDPASGRFHTFDSSNAMAILPGGRRRPLGPMSVKSIVEDNNGNIYIGTWSSGLLRHRMGTNLFYAYAPMNVNNSAFALCMDKNHHLWVGTWGFGVARVNTPENNSHPNVDIFPLGNALHADTFIPISALASDNNTLWIATKRGLASININALSNSDAISMSVSSKDGLPYDMTDCVGVATNRYGTVWAAMKDNGCICLSDRKSMFAPYSVIDGLGMASHVGVTSFGYLEGCLAIGRKGYGPCFFDWQSKRETSLLSVDDQTLRALYAVNSVAVRNNTLWMGTQGSGIVELTKKGRSLTRTFPILRMQTIPFLTDNTITALFTDSRGLVWIGQRNGISVMADRNHGKVIVPKLDGHSMGAFDVRGITEDHLGRIWVATDDQGILLLQGPKMSDVIHGKGRRIAVMATVFNPQGGNYTVSNALNCLEDTRRRIWAISSTDGLFEYDEKNNRFQNRSLQWELPDQILSIAEDSKGFLWLSSPSGLEKVNVSTDIPEVIHYDIHSNEQSFHLIPNAIYSIGDTLLLGTSEGFISFATKARQTKSDARSAVILSNIWIDGTDYNHLDSIQRHRLSAVTPIFTNHLVFSPYAKELAFDFAILGESFGRASFECMLEGYDTTWRQCHQQKATYENLPAGTYKLKVRALTDNGKWVVMSKTVEVVKKPYWWNTWWARTGELALIVLIVLLAIRLRRKWIAMRKESSMANAFARQASLSVQQLLPKQEMPEDDDQHFLQQAIDNVMTHLSDSSYDRAAFAADMNMGETSLYNRLRSITGMHVSRFIASIRLKAAHQMITDHPKMRVADVAYAVGFSTPNYFSTCFKKEFGMTVSEYANKCMADERKS